MFDTKDFGYVENQWEIIVTREPNMHFAPIRVFFILQGNLPLYD